MARAAHPRVREARARAGRADHAHAPTRARSTPRNLAFTTSPHEECAVEEAIRLVEAHGGDITVLTVGPPEAEEQLRFSVSVGAQHAVLVTNDAIADGDDPDPQATARAIADAVRALEADGGPFDLLLFGNESADAGGFQVGVRVARALGRPIVNGIKAIEVADGVLTARPRVRRRLRGVPARAARGVGVKEGINLPRYPTLPGRLRSKKAEVHDDRRRRPRRAGSRCCGSRRRWSRSPRPRSSAPAPTPRPRSSTSSYELGLA